MRKSTPNLFNALAILFIGVVWLAACSNSGSRGQPHLQLSLQSTELAAEPGGSVSVQLKVDASGFRGEVALSLESENGGDAPQGISLSPMKVQVPGGPYTLTLNVASSVKQQTYNLLLRGQYGKLSQTVPFKLTVQTNGPDFTLSATPTSLSAEPGKSTTTTVTLSAKNGFVGTVALNLLDADGQPANGFTLQPSSVDLTGSVSTPVSIQVSSSVTPGNYTLKLEATGGGQSHTVDLHLAVLYLNLTLSATALYAPQGGSADFTLTVQSVGLSGNMSLILSDQGGSSYPAGISLAQDSVMVPGGPYTLSIRVDNTVPTGTYGLRLRGELGGVVATVDFTLTVQPPPEFSASLAPSSISIALGQSDYLTLTLDFQKSFSGTINFSLESADGSPAPGWLSLSPLSIDITANPQDTQQIPLTLKVGTSGEGGTYHLRVRAQSTNTTQYAAFDLNVPPPPDLTISANTTQVPVVAGGSGILGLTITPHNDFNGSVGLSLQAQSGATLPSEVTLTPNTVDLSSGTSQNVQLSLAVGTSVQPKRYYLRICASGGNASPCVDFTLVVWNFSLSLGTSAPTFSAEQGGNTSGSLTISVSSPDNFSSFPNPINFRIATQDGSNLPPGLSVSPQNYNFPTNTLSKTITLTITTSQTTPPGSYALRVVGEATSAARSADFTLNVQGFSLSLSSDTLAFWSGGSGTLQATLEPGGGFSGNVTFSLEDQDGNQAPSGISLNPTSVSLTETKTTTLTIAADSTVAPGVYNLRLKATAGSLVQYANFTLQVEDFDISLNTQSLAVWQNTQGSLGVSVIPAGNFSGDLSLSLEAQPGSTLPSGISISPNSVAVSGSTSQALTLSASQNATPGLYHVQLRARATLNGIDRQKTATFDLTVDGLTLDSLDPSILPLVRGDSRTVTASITSYGINGPVNLSLENATGFAFSPDSINVQDGSHTYDLTITVDPTVSYGTFYRTYDLNLVASTANLAQKTSLSVVVYRTTYYWMPRTSSTSYDLYDAAFDGSGTFVAVGGGNASNGGSSYGVAIHSSDGVSWTASNDISNNPMYGVAYGNNYFVAVGVGCEIVSSTDGTGWTPEASPGAFGCNSTNANLEDITFDASSNRFVAVGGGGLVVTGTPGSWSTEATPTTADLNGVAYGNGVVVAVGGGGEVLYYDHGETIPTWTRVTSPTTADLTGVAFGDGAFVAVGKDGVVLTSTDGKSWSARNALGGDATGIVFGQDRNGAGIFVALVPQTNYAFFTSDDKGSTWRSQNSAGLNDPLGGTFGNHRYVVVGRDGNLVTSP